MLALESTLAPGGFPLGLAAALLLWAAHGHTVRLPAMHLAGPDGAERGPALAAERGLGVFGTESSVHVPGSPRGLLFLGLPVHVAGIGLLCGLVVLDRVRGEHIRPKV